MGAEVEQARYSRAQRQQYREKVRRDLDVFERMLHQDRFAPDEPMTGMELELNLVGEELQPSFRNSDVLAALDDRLWTTELAKFNIELNVDPRLLPGDAALGLEDDLRRELSRADVRARELGIRIASIGILPTIGPEHFAPGWMSDDVRYAALDNAILDARGEDLHLDLEGPTGERISRLADSLAPEASCTSMQLHLQVRPEAFARHWNAAQVIAGPQLAAGANSPYFLGQRLWAETRIPLFHQSTDTRPIELRNQGVRPRVWFGERWVTSIFDLFEENVRYFPALLPELSDEDPEAVLESGRTPELAELRLHNGTVYRWNRPIYDCAGGVPHLRVENRVMPAGPTIVDVMANAAFYYGCVRHLAEEERPVWSRMPFATAERNFEAGARDGIDAIVSWPGAGHVPARDLVLRRLLPHAQDGLRRWGVSEQVIDRYLTIIERRCALGVNGASWQVETVDALERQGATREAALRGMLERYLEGMHENVPVHEWERV